MRKWRREPGAYRSVPYVVWMQGGRWQARLARAAGATPLHLGVFESAQEAMSACAEHAEQVRERLGNAAP